MTAALLLVVALAECGHDPERPIGERPGETKSNTSTAQSTIPADPDFNLEWVRHDVPGIVDAGAAMEVSVTVRNASKRVWENPTSAKTADPKGGHAIRMSARWLDTEGKQEMPYAARSDLSAPLDPGDSATYVLRTLAPPRPGHYTLQIDLVEELVDWFEDKGAPRLVVPVEVR